MFSRGWIGLSRMASVVLLAEPPGEVQTGLRVVELV